MSADEFDAIAKYFAPLATTPGARGLRDDAAVLEHVGKLVVTTDAIVEGVHFLADDPIETIAKKALRVNLSDLAAKGAKPIGVVVALMWPNTRPASQIEAFACGLGEDLAAYECALLGGDTTSTPGPLAIAVTAFGAPLGAHIPSRADAVVGEHVWLTGPVGGAYLGLQLLTQTPNVLGAAPGDQTDAFAALLHARYRTPSPPVRHADLIAKYARASIDVSDGLVGDAAKIAAASRVALRIDAEAIPLDAPGHAFVEREGQAGLIALITGGDDYQTLFTAPAVLRGEIAAASRERDASFVLIGDVVEGEGAFVIGPGGARIDVSGSGHRHRLGV